MLEKVMMKQQYGNIRHFLQAGYSILLMYAAKTTKTTKTVASSSAVYKASAVQHPMCTSNFFCNVKHMQFLISSICLIYCKQ